MPKDDQGPRVDRSIHSVTPAGVERIDIDLGQLRDEASDLRQPPTSDQVGPAPEVEINFWFRVRRSWLARYASGVGRRLLDFRTLRNLGRGIIRLSPTEILAAVAGPVLAEAVDPSTPAKVKSMAEYQLQDAPERTKRVLAFAFLLINNAEKRLDDGAGLDDLVAITGDVMRDGRQFLEDLKAMRGELRSLDPRQVAAIPRELLVELDRFLWNLIEDEPDQLPQ